MSEQEYAEGRGRIADAVRLDVRTLLYVVVGGVSLAAIATVASVIGPALAFDLYTPPVAAWWTVFTAVVVQGIPFLLLGTVVSAAIGAFVPERVFSRLQPRNQALAVPVAGAAGAVLPGCECASVPVAGSLMRRGVAPAAALAFLLSAPSINPVVLVATSIAFPGQPLMVAARLVASLATAVLMGSGCGHASDARSGFGCRRRVQRERTRPVPVRSRLGCSTTSCSRGFLVLGSAAAATFNITVPRSVLDVFMGSAWLSVPLLALLPRCCACAERPTRSWPPR